MEHPGYLPTLGLPFRDQLGTVFVQPEDLVYFPRREGNDCHACAELRLGCDLCYQGNSALADLALPVPEIPVQALQLKDLDFRVFYHRVALEGQGTGQDPEQLNRQCSLMNWYTTRNPSEALMRKIMAHQMGDFREDWDSFEPIPVEQIGGKMQGPSGFSGLVRICPSCYFWFSRLEPEEALELRFTTGREEAYLSWLEALERSGQLQVL